MTCVEYKNINNIFKEKPYHLAIYESNELTNELYKANKDNLELINQLNGIINTLKNEVKSLKSNEKIVEVWKGNKIITYDRIKNKVTWRYWWADLPYNLIEDLMENAIKYYYQKKVLKIGVCGYTPIKQYEIYNSHIKMRLHNEWKKRTTYGACQGYLNNGKICNNMGEHIFDLRYQARGGVEGFNFGSHTFNSELLKLSGLLELNCYPHFCKRCLKKYMKRGNVYDEWLKDAGYGERDGYCIRIK